MIINFILIVLIFIISSYGSTKMLYAYGYSLPRELKTREDFTLLSMKLLLFALLVVIQLIILLLFGINPMDFRH